MIKLYIVEGPGRGQSFELKADTIHIGRSPDNDIQMNDRSVSRKHVKVLRKANKYLIEDLESTNGTFVNGKQIDSGEAFEVNEGVYNVLMQSSNISETLQKILKYILELLKRIDRGVFVLIDSQTGEISQLISTPKRRSDDAINVFSRTIVDRVIREGKAVIMLNTLMEDEVSLSDSLKLMKIKSVMCVPLISRS